MFFRLFFIVFLLIVTNIYRRRNVLAKNRQKLVKKMHIWFYKGNIVIYNLNFIIRSYKEILQRKFIKAFI